MFAKNSSSSSRFATKTSVSRPRDLVMSSVVPRPRSLGRKIPRLARGIFFRGFLKTFLEEELPLHISSLRQNKEGGWSIALRRLSGEGDEIGRASYLANFTQHTGQCPVSCISSGCPFVHPQTSSTSSMVATLLSLRRAFSLKSFETLPHWWQYSSIDSSASPHSHCSLISGNNLANNRSYGFSLAVSQSIILPSGVRT